MTYLFWRCAPPELRVPQEFLAQLEHDCLTVAVGPHGSVTPAPTLRKLAVDIVVMGECEEALVDLADDPSGYVPRQLDAVFTYGGSTPVVDAYESFGARMCVPVYNALDPETHYPVSPDPRYAYDLAFLGNRLPDREARVDRFFFEAARQLPDKRFILGGSGWESWQLPSNVEHIGHVPTRDHNAFNCSPLAVINIARDSMADVGYSPATRVFEAAGAGACMITDAWRGIEFFLEPGTEVLVAQNGSDVARLLNSLTSNQAHSIGRAALQRVIRDHTYEKRARMVLDILDSELTHKRSTTALRRATV